MKRALIFVAVALMAWLSGMIAVGQPGAKAQDAAAAADQQEKGAESEKAKSEEVKKAPRKLRVFELKHRKPFEIHQLLLMRAQPVFAQNSDGSVTQVSIQQMLPEGMSVAVDSDKGLLFVRGSSDHIKTVERLVKSLDVPADELKKQEFEGVTIIPVRHGNAATIHSILSQLGLDAQMVQLDKAGLIVVWSGKSDEDEETAKQIEEVIAKLDKEDTATTVVREPEATERKAEAKEQQTR